MQFFNNVFTMCSINATKYDFCRLNRVPTVIHWVSTNEFWCLDYFDIVTSKGETESIPNPTTVRQLGVSVTPYEAVQ